MKRSINKSLDTEFDMFGLKGANFYICAAVMVASLVIGLGIGGWIGISLFLISCCAVYFGIILLQSYHSLRSYRIMISSKSLPSYVFIRRGLKALFNRN